MEERRKKERKTNKFCAKSNLTLDDFWRGWVGRGLLQLRGGMCGRGSLLLHRHAVGLHDGLVLLPRGIRVTPRHEHLVLGRQEAGFILVFNTFPTANGDSPFLRFCTHGPRTGDPRFYSYFRFRGLLCARVTVLWEVVEGDYSSYTIRLACV